MAALFVILLVLLLVLAGDSLFVGFNASSRSGNTNAWDRPADILALHKFALSARVVSMTLIN